MMSLCNDGLPQIEMYKNFQQDIMCDENIECWLFVHKDTFENNYLATKRKNKLWRFIYLC